MAKMAMIRGVLVNLDNVLSIKKGANPTKIVVTYVNNVNEVIEYPDRISRDIFFENLKSIV